MDDEFIETDDDELICTGIQDKKMNMRKMGFTNTCRACGYHKNYCVCMLFVAS
ncbi:MAG: hypothetical protein GOV02_03885 [Candidatus Aenigmarchaeota archaeon]|nr:hypothetical protein [Candidatus Aenigmarchaeota archaeon]